MSVTVTMAETNVLRVGIQSPELLIVRNDNRAGIYKNFFSYMQPVALSEMSIAKLRLSYLRLDVGLGLIAELLLSQPSSASM